MCIPPRACITLHNAEFEIDCFGHILQNIIVKMWNKHGQFPPLHTTQLLIAYGTQDTYVAGHINMSQLSPYICMVQLKYLQ